MDPSSNADADGALEAATDGSSDTGDGAMVDGNRDDTMGSDVALLDTRETRDTNVDVGPHAGPAPVYLGSAGSFVVLAKTAISTVPTSAVTGDLGISPAAASFITGFSLTRAGTYWTSSQVVGKLYAADNDPPTPTAMTTAIGDMMTAYTDAAGRLTPDFLDFHTGAIGGLTLAPGLYKWNSSVGIADGVTLAGGANDTWIFQINGDLLESAGKRVTLSGGAQAKNVVWQITGHVDVGASAHFEGVVLCKTDVTLHTGASILGRLLSQTAVHLDGSAVTAPSL